MLAQAAASILPSGVAFSGYTAASNVKGPKYKDLASTSYATDTTGSLTLIPDLITPGNGESQRDGEQIRLTSVWGKGRWVAGTTGTVSDQVAYLVWDKSPNKTLPAITDILVSANSNSFPRDSTRRRFKILKRFSHFAVGNSTTPATGCEGADFDFYVKLPKYCVVEYDAAGTGAIGDIQTGGLYFITVGSVAAGTAAGVVTIGFRTRFINL